MYVYIPNTITPAVRSARRWDSNTVASVIQMKISMIPPQLPLSDRGKTLVTLAFGKLEDGLDEYYKIQMQNSYWRSLTGKIYTVTA